MLFGPSSANFEEAALPRKTIESRLSTIGESVQKLDERLVKSVETHNATMNRLEQEVMDLDTTAKYISNQIESLKGTLAQAAGSKR
jgi:hypothetical protein